MGARARNAITRERFIIMHDKIIPPFNGILPIALNERRLLSSNEDESLRDAIAFRQLIFAMRIIELSAVTCRRPAPS